MSRYDCADCGTLFGKAPMLKDSVWLSMAKKTSACACVVLSKDLGDTSFF